MLKKQKDNKCTGTDEIHSEQLKYSTSNSLVAVLWLFISMIWIVVAVSKTLLSSAIKCLHKKGLKSIAKNYRSIFIINSISRLLPRLIIERLREVLKKYPNTGLKYSYHIKSESSTREQRSVHKMSGSDRLRMLLLRILNLRIYDETFSRFGLTIATGKTQALSFNVPEEVVNAQSLISLREEPIENVRRFNTWDMFYQMKCQIMQVLF